MAARKTTTKKRVTTRDKAQRISSPRVVKALSFWHGVTSGALKYMPIDLSARQTAVLLHIYMEEAPHSIKTIAEDLDISKPAICRAVDTLEREKLVKRLRDRNDKRNVILQKTTRGSAYLSEFADIILSESKKAA